MEKNLAEYLRKHPECELYMNQDHHLTSEEVHSLLDLHAWFESAFHFAESTANCRAEQSTDLE